MSDELGELVKKYIVALAQKDNDIFTLYESNQRLMAQLEQARSEEQTARQACTNNTEQLQAIESELRMQCEGWTRLHEEHAILRGAAYESLDILDCRQVSDTSNDKNISPLASCLVEAARQLYRRCDDSVQTCQTARAHITQQHRQAEQALHHSEARERALLASCENSGRAQLCECALISLELCDDVRREVASVHAAQAQHQRDELTCAQEKVQMLYSQWTQCASECSALHGMLQERECALAQGQSSLSQFGVAATETVQLLAKRTVAAEAEWCNCLLALRQGGQAYTAAMLHRAAQEAAILRERQEHQDAMQAIQSRMHQTRYRLMRARQQWREMQQRCRRDTARNVLLWRRARRRHRRRCRAWRARLHSLQDQTHHTQRQEQREQQQRMQRQNVCHSEEAARRQIELAQSENREHTACAHAEGLQNMAGMQYRQHEATCSAQHYRLSHCELRQAERNQRALLCTWEGDTRVELTETSAAERTALQRAQQAACAMREEIVYWVDAAELLQREVRAARAAVARAQTARRIWEAQHSGETRMLRAVMSRVSSSACVSDGAIRAKERGDAEKRVVVLEEACRRSAGVIAQLRETLHRARIDDRDTTPQATVSTHSILHSM